MATANTTRRPVHEVRIGRIKAAIWENKTEQGMRHNVSITQTLSDATITLPTSKRSTKFIGRFMSCRGEWCQPLLRRFFIGDD